MQHWRRRNFIVSILFAVGISLPAIAGLWSRGASDSVAMLENRNAAPWPNGPTSIGEFNAAPRAIDAFIEDRFGFRDLLTAIDQWIREELDLGFGDGNVLIGDDGWLFLTSGGALDMHMGRMPFRGEEANAWLNGAEALNASVTARGATFAILLAPQKATIYAEHLPSFVTAGRGPSRLDVLEEGAAARGLAIVNAKSRMLEAKGDGKLYYQSDTHWTARGAWEAYNALIEGLVAQGVAVSAIDRRRIRFADFDFAGDLARMLNRQDRFRESAPSLVIESATSFSVTDVDDFTFDAFKTQITQTDAADKPTLLLIGDSYAYALMPVLRQSFSRVVFTHHHQGAFDRAVLDAYPSDIVVLQMVERALKHPLEPTVQPVTP